MPKVLVVGHGGREVALGKKLSEDAKVSFIAGHLNPSLKNIAAQTGGKCHIGSLTDGKSIVQIVKESSIDLVVVSSDGPLEAGVVDSLKAAGIPVIGPTRRGAEIEWNKSFARRLLSKIMPEHTPRFWIVEDEQTGNEIIQQTKKEKLEIVIKPEGLSAGKGVRVMGEHLKNYEEARDYMSQLLHSGAHSVLIEEKLSGVEFTLQAITDGKNVIRVPAAFDFPYRFDGDTGPGTGGMGSFCDKYEALPFISQANYDQCILIIKQVLEALIQDDREFNGVLYGGFFLTSKGVKVIEFNARFGDPECINIMAVLDSSLLSIFEKVTKKSLNQFDVKFKKVAAVTKYLVSPEYALREGKTHKFYMDTDAIKAKGVEVLFASAIDGDSLNNYVSLGNSRTVALSATSETIPEAASNIDTVIDKYFKGDLEFRRDIGSRAHLEKLMATSIATGRIT